MVADLKAQLVRVTAELDSLAGTVERIEENYNHCYERATAAEAALSTLTEKNVEWQKQHTAALHTGTPTTRD